MSKRIGEILLEDGQITREQLEQALERQSESPDDDRAWLGQILVEMGASNDEAVARGIARQQGFDYVNPSRHVIDPSLIWKVPRELAERHVVVPLDREGDGGDGPVRVAMADPRDIEALQDLEFLFRRRVKPLVASAAQIRQAIHRHYDMAPEAARMLAGLSPTGRGRASGAPQALELDASVIKSQLRAGGTKPYINLLNFLLYNSIQRGASDIHIEPGSEDVRVRFRIDGLLREVLRLPNWALAPLMTRIKVIGELDVSDHRHPQDGKVTVSIGDRRVDMRIATIPSQFGEKCVVRLLDPQMLLTDLGVMGWQPRALSAYYRMVSSPQGLVLVVGPTGSGKSTTLYGTIARLRAENTAIVTVEDPIEYTVEGISQVQVDEKHDLSFAQCVRSLLRQDPNVIVIGEIRDAATGHAAIEAATTGHLVLSTLHTNQTVSTVNRLLELGLPEYLLGSALLGVVAQRLLRRVCEECSFEGPVEEEDWFRLGVAPIELGDGCRRPGHGCPRCQYAAYAGRVGVFEVLQVSEEFKSMIMKRRTEDELWRQARLEGLSTLLDDALFKVHTGVTTMEEVARAIPIDSWRRREAAPLHDAKAGLEAPVPPWRPLWATDDIDQAITGIYRRSQIFEAEPSGARPERITEPPSAPPPPRVDDRAATSPERDALPLAAAPAEIADAIRAAAGEVASPPRDAVEAGAPLPQATTAAGASPEAQSARAEAAGEAVAPPPEPAADALAAAALEARTEAEAVEDLPAAPGGAPEVDTDDLPAPGRRESDLVLVVDDADEILQLVRLTLEDDYEVATARDGLEGLEAARKLQPALVVLDVMMPKLSGYDVCLRIKEDPRTERIPVLMLSARGEKQAVAKGFYAGADDYLPKPFDPEELLLRIRALIRRSRRLRPA
jgi:type IV pilus assembly protein PilB